MTTTTPILHPVAICQVMINFGAAYGVDKDTCLSGTGISEDKLAEEEAFIERVQELRLIENLILALPDEPALGFKLGLQYNIATFGVWGFALRTCKTLRDAISVALRYLPLSTAYCKIRKLEFAGHFGVEFEPETIPSQVRQFLLERDMATGSNIFKELSLSGASYLRLELKGAPPSYADAFQALVGIEPIFNSSRNALLVSAQNVDKLLPTYDSQLVQLMQNQCKQQLNLRQQTGMAGHVRQMILGRLGLVASLDEVAAALAMSPRSLRRKLDSEGTNFKELLDTERQLSAQQLLTNSDMKIEELAFHLGYTDAASFARAFRRWQGCSPGEYRKQA